MSAPEFTPCAVCAPHQEEAQVYAHLCAPCRQNYATIRDLRIRLAAMEAAVPGCRTISGARFGQTWSECRAKLEHVTWQRDQMRGDRNKVIDEIKRLSDERDALRSTLRSIRRLSELEKIK